MSGKDPRNTDYRHSETFPGWVPCPPCIVRTEPAVTPDSASPAAQQMVADRSATSDMDVLVQTMNVLGPQTVSRRFRAAPGTSRIQVRYRFATTEPQSSSPKNDTFLARVRNVTTGVVSEEWTSVAGLAGQLSGAGDKPSVVRVTDSVQGTNGLWGLVQYISQFQEQGVHQHNVRPFRLHVAAST